MRIAIAGSSGRMGRTLIESVLQDAALQLSGALEQPGHALLGRDAGELSGATTGICISADFAAVLAGSDAIIDFTRPAGTLAHLDACVKLGRKMVIGTTGFSQAEKARIAAAAAEIAIMFAPNMAIGVNVTFKLAEIAARSLGEDYDVEIIEAHHRQKVDAPSGTALKLGEVVAAALGRDPAKVFRHGREGDTGERDPREIAFHALRGGDIVGEHTVMFAGMGERVEVIVRSSSRATYASGALRAVKFLNDKQSGLFDMQDVLGLR
ncbi:MAG: 4-hydroxy-tetrahydrodipicolinate reductase [Betaproteobacteria bacterium]|nr:4-hydroxy-tetrahydrodipicolinate reductase [Betaproteobacteria bacterium]